MFRFHQKLAIYLIATFSLFLAGCAQIEQDFERIAKEGRERNQRSSAANATTPSQSLAQSAETAQGKPTQLIVPNDKSVAAAMDVAMPSIKKVISLHRCMKSGDNMRLLNFYAVTGRNIGDQYRYAYPNSADYMKYHDRNNCIAARTMDQWSMPALNALRFRVVYFAEDSGETVNFQYEFKITEDGSWKLDSLRRV